MKMKIIAILALAGTLTAYAGLNPVQRYNSNVQRPSEGRDLVFVQDSTQDLYWYFTEALETNVNLTSVKDLTGATSITFTFSPQDRSWRKTVPGALATLETTTTNIANGQVKFSFTTTQLTPNSNNGAFTYIISVKSGAANLAYVQGTLTILENVESTGGELYGIANIIINWLLYGGYTNTAAAGPYRAGQGIGFTTNTDGSCNIVSTNVPFNRTPANSATPGYVLIADAGGGTHWGVVSNDAAIITVSGGLLTWAGTTLGLSSQAVQEAVSAGTELDPKWASWMATNTQFATWDAGGAGGTNAQQRVGVLETNTATLAQGIAATNAQARVAVLETNTATKAQGIAATNHIALTGTNVHGLGTAATSNANAFASAAQGIFADGALLTNGGRAMAANLNMGSNDLDNAASIRMTGPNLNGGVEPPVSFFFEGGVNWNYGGTQFGLFGNYDDTSFPTWGKYLYLIGPGRSDFECPYIYMSTNSMVLGRSYGGAFQPNITLSYGVVTVAADLNMDGYGVTNTSELKLSWLYEPEPGVRQITPIGRIYADGSGIHFPYNDGSDVFYYHPLSSKTLYFYGDIEATNSTITAKEFVGGGCPSGAVATNDAKYLVAVTNNQTSPNFTTSLTINGRPVLTNAMPAFTSTWKIVYSGATTQKVELAMGAPNAYLKSTGLGSAPTWSAVSATATNVALSSLTDVTTNTWMPVGDGANLVMRSPAYVRTNLSLVVGTDIQAYNTNLTRFTTNLMGYVLENDGAGSGLDADLLDGFDSSDIFASCLQVDGSVPMAEDLNMGDNAIENAYGIFLGTGSEKCLNLADAYLAWTNSVIYFGGDGYKFYGDWNLQGGIFSNGVFRGDGSGLSGCPSGAVATNDASVTNARPASVEYDTFQTVVDRGNSATNIGLLRFAEEYTLMGGTNGNVGIGSTGHSWPNLNVVDGTWLGWAALYDAAGKESVAVGHGTLAHSPGEYNTGVGAGALTSAPGTGNSALGYSAGNSSTGSCNTALGRNALKYANGAYNVAAGQDAGYMAPGNFNTMIGAESGYEAAGNYNTMLGLDSGFRSLGTSNLFLGVNAGFSTSATYYTNAIAVGAGAVPGGNNSTVIGNPQTTNTVIYGVIHGDMSGGSGCPSGAVPTNNPRYLAAVTNGGATINGSPITNGSTFTITGGGGSGGISNISVAGVTGTLSGSGSNVLASVSLGDLASAGLTTNAGGAGAGWYAMTNGGWAFFTGGGVGPMGPPGTNGLNGTNGATGATGPSGTNGATGATGPQGPMGTNGVNGLNGTNGIDGTVLADTTYWVTNTTPFTNTIDFSVAGLVANKVTLHDVRMFLSLTNGSPISKRATIGMFRNSNRRCDTLTYLDTNQLYYSALTTVAGVAGENSNVVADASGSVVNDLYYKAIDGTDTNDYQRVQSASATAIIWQCTNLFNSGIGTLVSHVNQFGGFPYYDATGASSLWFRLTFASGYTGTVRTVINYGR